MTGKNLGLLLGCGGFIILAVIALIIGIWVITGRNSLVDRSTAVDAQWAQVETQYQRRFDLIPNLVESVKGIFEQERSIFQALADARTHYNDVISSGGSIDDRVGAATQVESALARLLVIVENYPELRSQQNVTQLMDELAGTENRIAVERSRFNDATRDYNRAVQKFPSNVLAGWFGYDQRPYFNAAEGTDQPPRVDLTK
jgi:LemA protein